MTTTPIPDEVRRYILASVPSVPYLEALLLLRSDPACPWDPRSVSRRLYIGETDAGEVLRGLAEAGIATQAEGGWSFAPADAELRQLLDQLAEAYAVHLVAVTEIIHSRVDRRARQFADAFRWKKEDR